MSDPVPASAAPAGFRLSPQQRLLWELERRPGSVSRRAYCVVRIDGGIDTATVQRPLEEAAEAHEILRTTFALLPAMDLPVQVINDVTAVVVNHVDVVGRPEAERRDALAATVQRHATPDGEAGPPLRATLISEAPDRHRLVLSLPSMCADATTLCSLVACIAEGVGSNAHGEGPLQYADVAEWLNDLLENDPTGEGRAHWLAVGRRLTPELLLPGRHSARSDAVEFTTVSVDPHLVASLDTVAARCGVSTESLVLACWLVVLWRSSGQRELAVGIAGEGRRLEELEGTLGLIERHVPLGVEVDPSEPVHHLASRVAATRREASRRQEYFDPNALDGDLWFVPAAFEWVELGPPLRADDVRFDIERVRACVDGFGVKLNCMRSSAGLDLELCVDPRAFDPTALANLLPQLTSGLAFVVADDSAAVGDIELLDEEQRAAVLARGVGSPMPEPDTTFVELFERQVRRTPARTAVDCGGETLTYEELDQHADRFAGQLHRRGARRGDLVGICLEPGVDAIVAILAVLKSGAAYVPLDHGSPAARLAALSADADLTLVVASSAAGHAFPSGAVVAIDEPQPSDWKRSDTGPAPNDLAYAIYTSGSTGGPKGVLVEHASVVALYRAMRRAIHDHHVAEHSQVALNASLTFDASVQQLVALLDGHTLHVLPDHVRRDADLLVQHVRNLRIDVLNCTPTQLGTLVAAGLLDASSHAPRVLLIAGEELPAPLWDAVAPASETAAYNIYGPTECTINATAGRIDGSRPPSIGTPLPGYEALVLDERMRPVATGVTGELYLGGPALARGYLSRPALTAERFVPHPFSAKHGARLYRTGDRAAQATDGHITFAGRTDNQVKIRGFRVEPAEVEAELQRVPGVRAGAISVTGSGRDLRLVAYWLPVDDRPPTDDDLREALAARLPEHLVPSAFVMLDVFPLTRTGKLDRAALPDPEGLRPSLRNAYVPAQSPTEKVLAETTAAILRLDRVGIDDNFFALGGDSIRTIEVRGRAAERSVVFAIQDLFEHQTIRALASVIDARSAVPAGPPRYAPFSLVTMAQRERMPADIADAYPLTSMQTGMLFHAEYLPDVPLFHNVRTMHLRSITDPSAIVAAIAELVEEHAALRTSFDLAAEGGPLQLVHRTADSPVTVEDLRDFDTDSQSRTIAAFLVAEQDRRFDWAHAPLVRFTLHRRSDTSFQLTLTLHEAVLDGWSVATLLSELVTRSLAIHQGQPLPIGTSPGAFGAFVAAERHAVMSGEGETVWRSLLEHATATRVASWESAGGTGSHVVPISEDAARRLHEIARMLDAPLKSVLLAVHVRAIAALAGTSDVVTGLVANGRLEDVGAERVAGQFLNTLPLCAHTRDGTWEDLVRDVARNERAMFPFRRTPIAAIQELVGCGSLFDTGFNFTHFHVYRDFLRSSGVDIIDDAFSEVTDLALLADFSVNPSTMQVGLTLNFNGVDVATSDASSEIYAACLADLLAHPQDPRADHPMRRSFDQPPTTSPGGSLQPKRPDASVINLFERQVERSPESVAVCCGEMVVTYSALHRRAESVARTLAAEGVGPDDVVGLLASRDADLVVGMLGIMKAGAAILSLDEREPPLRLRAVVRQAACPLLLTSGGRRLDAWLGRTIEIAEAAAHPALAVAIQRSAQADNIAYVISTSGSTGGPKAVLITHQGLDAHCRAKISQLGLASADVVAQTAPVAFDVYVWQVLAILAVGGMVRIVPDDALTEPGGLLPQLAINNVTVAQAVPSLLSKWLGANPPDLPRLRCMIATGEELTASLARRWHRRYPHVRLINAYGPAECADQVSSAAIDSGFLGSRCPIGRPAPGTSLRVLDDRMEAVASGAAGMLYVGGDSVGRGYLAAPRETAAAFVPDPWSPGQRLFRTGDIVRHRSDGDLEWLGRRDRQVKIRGVRIEPDGVETVLRQHPTVREAAVVVRDTQRGGLSLAAFVVTDPSFSAVEATLVQHARKHLPPGLVPAVVAVAGLPTTANGKLDRAAVCLSIDPVTDRPDRPPRTPTEAALAELWASTLGLETVGADTNFFVAGGTSLLALEVVARIRDALQTEIPLVALYECPTVALLAERLGQAQTARSSRGAR